MHTNRQSVQLYLQALGSADFSEVPFADQAEFHSPMLAEPLRGSGSLVAGLTEAAGGMSDVEVVQLIVEGDHASARIRFTAGDARVEVCDWFDCREGEITAVHAFYDPRPFL